jgi:hypothetical protein
MWYSPLIIDNDSVHMVSGNNPAFSVNSEGEAYLHAHLTKEGLEEIRQIVREELEMYLSKALYQQIGPGI